jgi:uncharacterized protein (DUF1800 family)
MKTRRTALLSFLLCVPVISEQSVPAGDPPPPAINYIQQAGTQVNLRFPPYPAAQAYTLLSTEDLTQPLTPNPNFFLAPYVISVVTNGATYTTNFGYEWRLIVTNPPPPTNGDNTGYGSYFKVRVTPMSSNALLSATVLNRLTYGPTPDEITRLASIGPDAYIAEQLAPWNITEDVEATHTNFQFIQAQFVEATNFVVGKWPHYYTNTDYTTNGSVITTNHITVTNAVYGTNATVEDLRAWHVLRAIGARRQLLEIMLQFLENHFVTQWSKSRNTYFNTYYDDGTYQDALATQLEYLENENWRAALLKTNCTFYDLLKVSAESPAMIIYLDTYSSKGNGSNIANENYARELMELFTMGVDNGYDQNDITVQSRIWTGWNIEKVDFTNAFNPFAPETTVVFPGSTNNSTTRSNLYGVWAFNYQTNRHNNSTKTIFPAKIVPARLGAPWTTKTYGTNTVPGKYEIVIPGHSTSDTNGISEGYQFIQYIADLPFTEEYISVKLCRLLVHDNFPNPSNDPSNDVYSVYNYAAGNLSPEADLVHRCMLTWETNSPKGQIWKVLKTITDSGLFRGHDASQQKIKTPLEFAVSAVRALRSSTNGSNLAGSFTSYSDGYNIGGTGASTATVLSRAGNMLLFDRDAPDGYPETGPPWISAGTLAERLRFVQSFCIAIGQAGHTSTTNDAGSNTGCDIVGLLKAKTPSSTWNNAGAVADYFTGLLLPGEGAGNLALYRQAAIDFLNNGSADTDITPDYRNTSFSGLPVTSTAGQPYDERVRGMVGMLITMPRFQEQ